MDPLFYLRIGFSGWAFLAVLAASALFSGAWAQLPWWPKPGPAGQFGLDKLVPLVGALVAAPPLIGFLLERTVSVILFWSHVNLWKYPCAKRAKDLWSSDRPDGDGGAYFHVFFYSFAGKELLEWSRRRRAQFYASLTCTLALGLGLCAAALLRAWHWPTFLLTLVAGAVTGYHGVREIGMHRQTLAIWVETLGLEKIRKSPAKEGA